MAREGGGVEVIKRLVGLVVGAAVSLALVATLAQTAPAQTQSVGAIIASLVPMIYTETGQGSGWVVSDSLVVTARHVTHWSAAVRVVFGRVSAMADVVCESQEHDLALVRVRENRLTRWLATGAMPKFGTRVMLFGYAAGNPMVLNASVQRGGSSTVIDGEVVGPYVTLESPYLMFPSVSDAGPQFWSKAFAGMSGGPVIVSTSYAVDRETAIAKSLGADGMVVADITGTEVRQTSYGGRVITFPMSILASTLDWEEGCRP